MKLRFISILSILSIFLFSSVALSQDVPENLDVEEIQVSSGLEVLSPKKVIEPSIVKALPVLQSAEEEKILEDLKNARHAGDRDAARALKLELDELRGILPNAPQPTDNEQEEVIFEEPSQGPQPLPFKWVDGDIRINVSSYDVVKPAMASAPNGDLYVAMEDRDNTYIRVYKSTDNGATWSSFINLSFGNDLRNPSIAATDFNVYVAYEVWYTNTNRAVRVYTQPTDGSSGHGAYVVENISDTPNFICPEICTDYLEYPGDTFVYVTYAAKHLSYYYVYFSKSEDNGQNFSTPVNLTGGTAYSAWETKPDIAFGTTNNDLFIAFVKPGLTSGSVFVDKMVFVTKSTDYGDSWDTPVRLTDVSNDCYHPRVSAAHGRDSVIVAYTYEYSLTDEDVRYHYSTNGGLTWSGPNSLATSGDDENSAALSVSNDEGRFHVAYYKDHDIWYRSADTASPTSWSTTQLINESNKASGDYPRPTITVNPTMPEADEACIAWSDYRAVGASNYDIYFDSASLPIESDVFIFEHADFFGDFKTDITVFRPSTGVWWVRGFGTVPWGQSGDIPVPGNYDGVGKTDFAVFRPSTGKWWIRGGSPQVVSWGKQGDIPVPGDYDGDGKTDYAVFRPSTGVWWIKNKMTGVVTTVPYGQQGDIPVPGDYNTDGITDIAVWRPSTGVWWLRGFGTVPWGQQGDIPAPGNYNGDFNGTSGTTDLAVFRPSTGKWWIRIDGSPPVVSGVSWGQQGDIPVPGYYNVDSTTDIAVWRPSTGVWWLRGIGTVPWGISTDIPICD